MRYALAILSLFFLSIAPSLTEGSENGTIPKGLSRGEILLSYFQDTEMDFQLLRSLGADATGGGSPGEILLAAKDIEEGDPASWSAAFLSLAERVETDGRTRLKRGHEISAGESLLRAASYYRAAEYYGDPTSPETAKWGMKCRKAFIDGMKLSPWEIEELYIPFGEDSLPGYFISSPSNDTPRKTLIAQSGFDGTAEEMYFAVGEAALRRGYNVLLFEGPGQVGKRRFDKESTFVPDTSPALRAVVDFALSRPEIDPEKIALYGASFGGYFALSGAVGESRLKALIVNSPIIDAREYFFAAVGPKFVEMFEKQDLTVEEILKLPKEELPPKYRFSLLNLCIRYGKPSVKTTLEAMQAFHVDEDRIEAMEFPALGMVGEKEGTVPLSQAKRFEKLAQKGSLHIFEEKSGANIHCQLDNMPLSWAVALDWLDEQFD
ncbi:alpha/beta hydrolase [Dethiosulfovibrio sp. F2B]|uniref:alpha/beta hydrolase family protein n=1 Tax=Dethiosulfovibrio faecalis TaxID=2720018 RepID=UPI001F24DC28|nr:alpha/beta hydrolase [Dethiosulfovibrio faecalis]MCF4151356.1 alpha/beta hydrolase [Dethiosulfovibrio faecalis]